MNVVSKIQLFPGSHGPRGNPAQAVCIPIDAHQGSRALGNEKKADSCFPPSRAGSRTYLGRQSAFPRGGVGTGVLQTGFTLMELLVVITLLGMLAGAAVLGYEGVQEQGRNDVTRFQMAELRQALLRFRSDSGSRDFPGQGQYVCEDPDNAGSINPDLVGLPAEAGTTDAQKIAWCQATANFWMLFADPLGNGWNPDTHRGWHGPYLQRKNGPINTFWVVIDAYGTPLEFEPDTSGSNNDRIVSAGPDGIKASPAADPCQPAAGSDDLVLCLLR